MDNREDNPMGWMSILQDIFDNELFRKEGGVNVNKREGPQYSSVAFPAVDQLAMTMTRILSYFY